MKRLEELLTTITTGLIMVGGLAVILGCWSLMVLAAGYVGGICWPDRPVDVCRAGYGDYVLSGEWWPLAVGTLVALLLTMIIAAAASGWSD
ncbi:MAG: hypothetical protein R3300_07835 [Candidatus Promineifilaceae bacterium]|nr:hypothetical protein [Candidatus Promineifilaceae bacterium]